MKIVFLSSTDADIRWFKRYYRKVFPEGSNRANLQMRRTLAVLRDNPHIGRPIDESAFRRLTILNTPFALKYRLSEDTIEILRVLDGRANPLESTEQ